VNSGAYLKEIAMIKKIGLLLAGAMGLYALEACVVVDCSADPNNAACAGTAGTGGGGGEGNTGNNGGSAGAGVGGGMAGMGGMAACVNTCIEVASDNTQVPCAGTPAEMAWSTLSNCVCKTAGADGCADVCADNRCMGATSSADCDKCVQQGACSDELTACTSN
jgi:hypothetical protein